MKNKIKTKRAFDAQKSGFSVNITKGRAVRIKWKVHHKVLLI